MNYELAKKLQEAGFPQHIRLGSIFTLETSEEIIARPNVEDRTFASDVEGPAEDWRLLRPQTHEVIEACGSRFRHLSRYETTREGVSWKASGVDQGENVMVDSLTPLGAAAGLWFALNKQKPTPPVHYPEN